MTEKQKFVWFFFEHVLPTDPQFDINNDMFCGFINLDPSDHNSPWSDVLKYMVDNYQECQIVALKCGYTIDENPNYNEIIIGEAVKREKPRKDVVSLEKKLKMKTFVITNLRGDKCYMKAFCKKSAKFTYMMSLITEDVLKHLMEEDDDMTPELALLQALDVQADIFKDEYTIEEKDVRGDLKDTSMVDPYIMGLYIRTIIKSKCTK